MELMESKPEQTDGAAERQEARETGRTVNNGIEKKTAPRQTRIE